MNQFDKFKDITGKKDSLYLYVLFECKYDEIKEHVKKQMDILDRAKDPYKRRLYYSRYRLLKEHLEEFDDSHIFNSIIFLGEDMEVFNISKSCLKLLREYSHRNISYTYNDYYDMEYLNDLLFNDQPYHIFKLNNNKIEYIKMTKTKKYIVTSKESKSLDVSEFIDENVSPKDRYVIYGVSSKLENFTDDRAYDIIRKSLKDEEIIDLTSKIEQEDILISLDEDLKMLQDDKQVNKVVFKKDILKAIKHGKLEKLYIEKKMCKKFMDNMAKLKLDINFKIIEIDVMNKSFVEDREKTIMVHGGVVGINYY